MKIIGIMTWFAYQNYGTALQAVALSKVLRDLGYEAINISYDPELSLRKNKLNLGTRILNRIRGSYPISSEERAKSFDSFIRDNLITTQKVESEEDFHTLNEAFSAFVCGSDQVWSPFCFDSHYYLDFVEDSRRKIAYAPSFGCDRIEDTVIANRIKGLLSKFGSISVREKSGAEIVNTLIGDLPPIVLDPTLLLDEVQWSSFVHSDLSTPKKYCLFYFLGNDSGNLEAAKRVAMKRGLEILSIPVFANQRGKAETADEGTGPEEFVSLVSRAELICTDSFHGMVFASIFKKPLIAFERFNPSHAKSQNTRVYNFLEMIGETDLLLTREKISEWNKFLDPTPNYDQIANRIIQGREKSLDYLSSALLKATEEFQ